MIKLQNKQTKKKKKKKREKSETKVIDVPVSFGLPIIENHVNNP